MDQALTAVLTLDGVGVVYADHYLDAYKDAQVKIPVPGPISQSLPEDSSGFRATQSVSVQISNVKMPTGSTVAQLLATFDLLGRTGSYVVYDPNTSTELVRLDGKVTEVLPEQELATVTLEQDDTAALQALLPKKTIRSVYPSAAFDTLSGSAGDLPVRVPWGVWRRVPCAQVHATFLWAVFSMTAAGDSFLYVDLTNVSNLIVTSGMLLQYDILLDQSTARIAVDLETTDATALRDLGVVDQNGRSSHPATDLSAVAFGQWYRREIAIPAGMVGKTIDSFLLACENNTTGTFSAKLANIRIVDQYGQVRQTLYDQYSQPTYNPVLNSGGNTLVCSQIVGFDYGPFRKPVTITDSFPGSSLGAAWTALHLDGTGSVTVAGGTVTVDCAGTGNFAGTADDGSLIYRTVGTTVWMAEVDLVGSIPATNSRYLMARASTAAGAAFFCIQSGNSNAAMLARWRDSTGATSGANTTGPAWNPALATRLRLTYDGTTCAAYVSQNNGVTWAYIGSRAIAGLTLLCLCDSLATGASIYDNFELSPQHFLVTYSDKRVVPLTDWTAVEIPTGYYVIRFAVDQRDTSLRPLPIHVDVSNEEFSSNPALVKKFFLNDATYGLGLPVNAASFTAAAADYVTRGISVIGGTEVQRPAVDLLKDLTFHGSQIGVNSAKEYTETVDMAALHSLVSGLEMGDGDPKWDNIMFRAVAYKLSDRTKSLTLRGMRMLDFEGSETFLTTATQSRVVEGVAATADAPYLSRTSVDKECYYRFKSQQYASQFKGAADAKSFELKAVTLNNLIPLHLPNQPYIDGQTLMAWGREVGPKNLSFQLRGYNAAIFSYVAGVINVEPSAFTVADYSFTAPSAPVIVSVIHDSYVQSGTGEYTVRTHILATADSTPNVDQLLFKVYRASDPSRAFRTHLVPCSPGATKERSFENQTNESLIFAVSCVASGNKPGFQESAEAISAYLTPNTPPAPLAPTAPTAIAVSQQGAKVVEIRATFTPPKGNWEAKLYRNLSGTTFAGATVIDTRKAHVFHDTNLAYGDHPYYWVTVLDAAGQESGPSPSSNHNVIVGKLGNVDITGTLTIDGAGGTAISITADSAITINYAVFAKMKWLSGATEIFNMGAGSAGGFTGFQIEPAGGDNTYDLRLGTGANRLRNLQLYAATQVQFLGGGVLSLVNATAAPASPPAGTIYLYGAAGGISAKTNSGRITLVVQNTPFTIAGSRSNSGGSIPALDSLLANLATKGEVIDGTVP